MLSVTPGYLHQIGLVERGQALAGSRHQPQMKMALDKIAFLPFGKLIDEWRWGVFDGRIKPADYNKAWWELRAKYQGVAPPVARSEEDFDPGAKYHIPGNTPYTRYFLSLHPAVPVPQGAVRRGRVQGPAARVLDLRQQGSRREATPRC